MTPLWRTGSLVLALAVTGLTLPSAGQTVWKAAAAGDVAALRQSLDGSHINARDEGNGWTPLIHAIRAGKVEAVQVLLEAGADPSIPSAERCLPLAFAAEGGDTRILQLLLAKGADPNAFEPPYYTPLAYAAKKGHLEAMKLLVKAGAKVDGGNRVGITPLFLASSHGQVEAARWLIDSGAPVDASNEDGYTPLLWAAGTGQVQVAKLLLDRGADPCDSNGQQSAIGQAARYDYPEIVLLLADRGADVNVDLNFESSPLSYACGNGNLALARELIRRGAKYQKHDEGLHEAAARGHATCVQLLLEQDARLGDEDLQTTLAKVIDAGHAEVAVLLFQASRKWQGLPPAEAHQREDQLLMAAWRGDLDGLRVALAGLAVGNAQVLEAALRFAAQEGHVDAVRLLQAMTAAALENARAQQQRNEQLLEAARRSDWAAAKALLEAGADADSRDATGWGALEDAASTGNLEMVQLLVERGAQVSAVRGSATAPLYGAAMNGRAAVVKFLLQRGAPLDESREAYTHLTVAAMGGHLEVVRVLLDAGADINRRSYRNRTALMEAAAAGELKVVQLLLARGAAVGLVDKYDWTALSLAEGYGHVAVTAALKAAGAQRGPAPLPSRLIPAMNKGVPEVERVLNGGADPNQWDPLFEQLPLQAAFENTHDEIMPAKLLKVLLERGADPRRVPDLLARAAERWNDGEIVDLLVAHGADPNSTAYGVTPLIAAARGGRVATAKALLQAGAKPDWRMANGDSALDVARRRGHAELVQVLQQAIDSAASKR